MDEVEAVKRDFLAYRLSYRDAIGRLEDCGYERQVAEDLVFEWESAAEQEHM